ncbi:MAG: hypothetical protein HFH36_11960 [Lachnospiraceae bacterium]|nr:hypothetical protein [Lachnospiraceae bacterium]
MRQTLTPGYLLCVVVSCFALLFRLSGKTGSFVVCHGIHGGQGLAQQCGNCLSYIA